MYLPKELLLLHSRARTRVTLLSVMLIRRLRMRRKAGGDVNTAGRNRRPENHESHRVNGSSFNWIQPGCNRLYRITRPAGNSLGAAFDNLPIERPYLTADNSRFVARIARDDIDRVTLANCTDLHRLLHYTAAIVSLADCYRVDARCCVI